MQARPRPRTYGVNGSFGLTPPDILLGTPLGRCVFLSRALNRSAVGRCPSHRPQAVGLTNSPHRLRLRAMIVPTRRAVLSRVWRSSTAVSIRSSTPRPVGSFPSHRPLLIYSIYIKAKAVPVAASSSAVVSARPTGAGVEPHSVTASRIQDSSDHAHLNERLCPSVASGLPALPTHQTDPETEGGLDSFGPRTDRGL